jgi:hypothetical protein
MLLAAADPAWLVPVICVVVLSGMTALILASLSFARRFLRRGADALKRTYDGIETRAEPCPGDVRIVFRTYYGFLGGGYQTEHRVFLPPLDAERLLERLHRFNLRWGWFGPLGLFIPFISYASYRSQLRAIKNQSDGRAAEQTGSS